VPLLLTQMRPSMKNWLLHTTPLLHLPPYHRTTVSHLPSNLLGLHLLRNPMQREETSWVSLPSTKLVRSIPSTISYSLLTHLKALALIVQWTDDAEDATANAQINSLISTLRSTASARGELLDFQFMNDSGYQQDPLKSYGASNLATIQAVAKKYDPKAVFQKLQNNGFKFSKA
jgi:hypothetical protein